MARQDRITSLLQSALLPSFLAVRDVSHQHHGHAGWREGGETHFEVDIASSLFDGQTRVAAHRMVNDALAEELNTGLHALQIKIIKN